MQFIQTKEACELLKCNKQTLHNYWLQGLIQKHRIGGRVLYSRKNLINAIKEVVPPTSEAPEREASEAPEKFSISVNGIKKI